MPVSIKAMVTVWENSKQRGNGLLLMLAIADFMNDYGEAWPSIDRLAEKTRCNRSTVIDMMKRCHSDGELDLEEGAGRNGTNRYRLGNHYRLLGLESPTPSPADTGQSETPTATSTSRSRNQGVGIRLPESDPILKEPSLITPALEERVNDGLSRKSPPGPDLVVCPRCGNPIRPENVDMPCQFHGVPKPQWAEDDR